MLRRASASSSTRAAWRSLLSSGASSARTRRSSRRRDSRAPSSFRMRASRRRASGGSSTSLSGCARHRAARRLLIRRRAAALLRLRPRCVTAARGRRRISRSRRCRGWAATRARRLCSRSFTGSLEGRWPRASRPASPRPRCATGARTGRGRCPRATSSSARPTARLSRASAGCRSTSRSASQRTVWISRTFSRRTARRGYLPRATSSTRSATFRATSARARASAPPARRPSAARCPRASGSIASASCRA
mmetsp:Transcript_50132/g.161441  ORF Transcript_50132/g.161441 Transcript_50132/m.161441 type:complete len:250 (-) Transcript_50132:7-756(-)